MTANTTKKIRPIEIVTALEEITMGLEGLVALLQVYDERWEKELAGVDPKEPWTAEILIARKSLNQALLLAIMDKAVRLREDADSTTTRALDLAREAKAEKEAT